MDNKGQEVTHRVEVLASTVSQYWKGEQVGVPAGVVTSEGRADATARVCSGWNGGRSQQRRPLPAGSGPQPHHLRHCTRLLFLPPQGCVETNDSG